MPFTPLHMGPGFLIKAPAQGSISLMVFGWTQILMDIQPLVVLLTGEGALHGWSHTLVGATLIAPIAAVTGKYAGAVGLRILAFDRYLPLRWGPSVGAAMIGAYSHVLVDAVMHADVALFWPASEAKPLYGLLSLSGLRRACLASGALGVAGIGCYTLWSRRCRTQAWPPRDA